LLAQVVTNAIDQCCIVSHGRVHKTDRKQTQTYPNQQASIKSLHQFGTSGTRYCQLKFSVNHPPRDQWLGKHRRNCKHCHTNWLLGRRQVVRIIVNAIGIKLPVNPCKARNTIIEGDCHAQHMEEDEQGGIDD